MFDRLALLLGVFTYCFVSPTGISAAPVYGTAAGANTNISLAVLIDDTTAYFEMSGPTNRWFSWGFGSTMMNGTYAIVASGSPLRITERQLGSHDAGTLLTSSITVVSSCILSNRLYSFFFRPRSVTGRYSFSGQPTTISVIWARGTDTTFAYEGLDGHGTGSLPVTEAHPKFTDMAVSGGVTTLSLTNLAIIRTNYLEAATSLVSNDWNVIATLIEPPPCGPSMLNFLTNSTISVTNVGPTFFRSRY